MLRDGSTGMIELSLSQTDNGQTRGLTSSPDVAASVLGRYQPTRLKALHFRHIRQSKKEKGVVLASKTFPGPMSRVC